MNIRSKKFSWINNFYNGIRKRLVYENVIARAAGALKREVSGLIWRREPSTVVTFCVTVFQYLALFTSAVLPE